MKAHMRDTMSDSIEIYNHAARVTTLRDISIFLTIFKEKYNLEEEHLKQLMTAFYTFGNDERFTELAIKDGNVIDYFNNYIKDNFNIDFESFGLNGELTDEKKEEQE